MNIKAKSRNGLLVKKVGGGQFKFKYPHTKISTLSEIPFIHFIWLIMSKDDIFPEPFRNTETNRIIEHSICQQLLVRGESQLICCYVQQGDTSSGWTVVSNMLPDSLNVELHSDCICLWLSNAWQNNKAEWPYRKITHATLMGTDRSTAQGWHFPAEPQIILVICKK